MAISDQELQNALLAVLIGETDAIETVGCRSCSSR